MYFENSTFGVITCWSGQDPWTGYLCFIEVFTICNSQKYNLSFASVFDTSTPYKNTGKRRRMTRHDSDITWERGRHTCRAVAAAARQQHNRAGKHLQVAGENELIGSRDSDEPGGWAGRQVDKHGRANGQRARQHDNDNDDDNNDDV